ncbi:MAG: acyltransferase [Oceanococcus sp.]
MSHIGRLARWAKHGDSRYARATARLYYELRYFTVPLIPGVHTLLYLLHRRLTGSWHWLIQTFYFSPLFRSRCESCGGRLYLYTGMPYIAGPLRIRIGRNCRISGQTTLNGRSSSTPLPLLEIGDNCDIGWQNSLSVGTNIRIGNNVRFAGKVSLAGYPGHPVNAKDRAEGLPDTDDQARDIIIENDVWVGTGATINAGVTIGQASIVASDSVVTKSMPEHVLIGGNPARIIRTLTHD